MGEGNWERHRRSIWLRSQTRGIGTVGRMRVNALQPIGCRRLWLGGKWPIFDPLRTSWEELDEAARGL